MKKNENYPKYVQAMHLMDEGKTVQYVVKNLGIGVETVRRLRRVYLSGGELAMLQPFRKAQVEPEIKQKILLEIEEKGISLYQAAAQYNIPSRTLTRWQRSYRQHGIAGLARKDHTKNMKKKRQRTEAEMDELEMLRKRNEYLEAENALLKKVKALVEEREARLRAIGQKPSKS